MNTAIFTPLPLDHEHGVLLGRLPQELAWSTTQFEAFWQQHPRDFHIIKMMGRPTPVPRWSQSYGRDYEYSGIVHRALPIPDELQHLLAWSKCEVDQRLNGILVNWYDG